MDTRTQLLELQRHWTPPDGLELSRSRPICLTAAGKALTVWVVVLVLGGLAGGIALAVVASRQAAERQLMREQGAETVGRVVRLWRGGEKGRERRAAYEFTAQGRVYQGQATLPREVWEGLQPGSDLGVRYVPSRPELNHPSGHEGTPMPFWIPGLVAVSVAGSGLLAMIPLRRQRWLLAQGRPALGLVTRQTKIQHRAWLYYEFLLLSGSVAKGRGAPTGGLPAVGSSICVIYDPDNPRRSAPYPFPLVKPVYMRRTMSR
jgi:hypothetical protein